MRFTILAGASALAIAVPSLAQTAAPSVAPPRAANIEEANAEVITVTGSRIARSGLDAAVPITSLTSEELLSNGQVSLGDRLALLPQFAPTFTTQNAGRFIGTAGLSVLNLRNQGVARTLVLQNGRRHVTSDPGTQTVDVNTIPTDLLERVDIVTGGNSAVYGSDAVAGVVNFVLKRDFEGFNVRGQIGMSDRGDLGQQLVSAVAGRNFADGRGNVAVAFEFANQDPLYFRDREWAGAFNGRSQFQLTENTAFSGAGGTPEPAAGNGTIDTSFTTGIKNIGISLGGAYTSTCQGVTDPTRIATNCGGVFGPTSTGGVFNPVGTQFGNVFVFQPDGTLVRNPVTRDFRPFGSGNGQGGLGSTLRESGLLQTGNRRYVGNIIASFEVSPAFRPFVEAKYVRTESIQEGQPTFIPGGTISSASFSLSNPFLTTQAQNLLRASLGPTATSFTMQRFNIDFGGRGENHSRDLYRVVAGVDGSFLDTWRYELSFNYGRTQTYYQTRGNILTARYNNAVNAVRNTAGQIVCGINADAVTTNDDPNCAPLNLFGYGAPSQAALQYILFNSSRKQWAEQFNVLGYVSGDSGRWFELPGGPVGFSVGAEWRTDDSYSAFDETTRSGATFLNAIGVFDPAKQEVWEAFGELRLPILKDKPFFHELTAEGAVRVSDYNIGRTGTVWAYNYGGIWSPVQDLRIRGGFARAVRAPTQANLFGATSQTFLNGLVDPCGQQNINANPNRVRNCAAAGVPTTQTFNGVTDRFTNIPASGISGLNAGNPNLEAERSNSWTLGAVLQPRFIPGLALSVDWYRIKISNVINSILPQTIINQCYDSPDGINNQFCGSIFRNPNGTFQGQTSVQHVGANVSFPATGQSFLARPFNYARQETEGVDFDLSYRTEFGADWRLGVRGVVSLLLKRNEFTSITEPNRLTQILRTQGNPRWNGQAQLTVGYKAIDVLYTFRYLDKMSVATDFRTQNSEQGRPPENADNFPFAYYPVWTYSDVRVTARVTDKLNFYVGVDNIFDRNPPYDLDGTAAGSGIYLNGGRFLYTGFNVSF